MIIIHKRKFSIFVIMVVLIAQSISLPSYTFVSAAENEQQAVANVNKRVINVDDVPLYEEDDESSNILISLKNNNEVAILEEFEVFSYVEYIDEEMQVWQGYIENKYLFNNNNEEVVVDSDEDTEIVESDSQEPTKVDEQETSEENSPRNVSSSGQTYYGIAVNKTNVYEHQSKDSKVLRSYSAGANLKYRELNADWYEATVIISGKAVTGFIHKSDVENKVTNQESLQGIALKSPTHVFQKATTDSKSLRSYPVGSILKYKTFTKNWYEATVIIKGKRTTGYIHKSHVENAVENQKSIQGIALNSPTHVYQRAATNSKSLRSYAAGSVLKYKTFSKNWYEATVIIKGKRTTGYIHKSHVENAASEQESLQGVAIKKPTHVYARASTSSKTLRQYAYSTILKFKSFSSNWYEATVIINGKRTTGYIRKADVESMDYRFEGFAHKNPTNIYSEAARSSKVLRTYARGSNLIYRAYNKDWWTVTVRINGNWETGYVHKNDVSFEMRDLIYKTHYDYDYKEMADRQAKKKPNADGAGKIEATRGQIEFYSNPLNFPKTSDEYYQFLVLSQPAGISAKQINNSILNDNAGVLKGQAKAFIDAGKELKINEIYLIAHALHETGNGKSTLASGIPVDKDGKVTKDKDGNMAKTDKTVATVYNMFGNGAYTSCPIDCGAKYAYDNEWFSVKAAIVGGIQDISKYINRGQDTLYKMRWNPIGGTPNPPFAEWNQYATHIQWATITTKRIAQMYSLLEDYTLEIDVPSFNNLPDYKKGAPATTTANPLKFRSGPGTSYNEIGTIPKGSEVLIVGSNVNAWYNIKYNGQTGWVSAQYVNLKY